MDDLLDKEICHCGTVRQAIDAALDRTFKEGEDCPVWDILVAMLTTNIMANVLLHDHITKGLDQTKAKAETMKHMKTLEFTLKEIMTQCSDYIEAGVTQRFAEAEKQEGDDKEEEVTGTVH